MLWTFLCFSPSKQVHSEQLYQWWMHLLPISGWPCNPPSALHPRNTHLQPAAHGRSRFMQFISPQLLNQSWPLRPRKHETGTGEKNGGEIFSGKTGLGRGGGGGYGVSRFKQQRGANWSWNQAQVRATTATDTKLRLWGLVRMQTRASTWCRQTPDTHKCAPPSSPHYSNMHVKTKTAEQECCSDRPVFPQREVWHIWEIMEKNPRAFPFTAPEDKTIN